MDDFATRCASHAPVPERGSFAPGEVFGDWRLTAFIGNGGTGETYCAVHLLLGTPAAVKVLIRGEDRVKARFAREAEFLARMKSNVFPRFFAYGVKGGVPYLAMELLEPWDLPSGDRDVAEFILKVCGAVAELHALGFIHRDIKPGNILWRRSSSGTATPVLVDFGLVERIAEGQTVTSATPPTLVDGLRVGVGTPGYSAPEQMERGEASSVSDIHALGVLIDRCFEGKPPRVWKRIVERATSSLPTYRYPSVPALMRAIRTRHRTMRRLILLSLFVLFAVGSWLFWRHVSAERRIRAEKADLEHEEIQEMLQRDIY